MQSRSQSQQQQLTRALDMMTLEQRIATETRWAVEGFYAYLQVCESDGRWTRIERWMEPDDVCRMAAKRVDEILARPTWSAMVGQFEIARRAGQWAWLAGAGRTAEGD